MKAVSEVGMRKIIKYVFFSLWQYLFSLMFVSPLRVFLLRLSGAKIDKNTVIEKISFMNLYRTGISGLKIGKNCFLGDGAVLDMADRIILGDSVTLSAGTFVLTHTNVGYKDHPFQKHIPSMKKSVRFKNGCFVGVRCVIFPGVVMEEESAVAACALVNKNVKSKTLVGGIPAVEIKKF